MYFTSSNSFPSVPSLTAASSRFLISATLSSTLKSSISISGFPITLIIQLNLLAAEKLSVSQAYNTFLNFLNRALRGTAKTGISIFLMTDVVVLPCRSCSKERSAIPITTSSAPVLSSTAASSSFRKE
ncbi:hypothetical protein D3C72_1819210 [compost metagenome]